MYVFFYKKVLRMRRTAEFGYNELIEIKQICP